MAGKIRNGYQFWETIGQGTWAKVKRVVRMRDGQPLAAKIFYQCTLRRKLRNGRQKLQAEYAMLSALPAHPNILSYVDIFEDDDKVYLIVDLLDVSLDKYVISTGHDDLVSLEWIKGCTRQLLGGLAHLHAHGIAHHDIKPANLLLSDPNDLRRMRLKICDFGIAEQVAANGLCGSCFGTPAFQAPEVVLYDPVDAVHPNGGVTGRATDKGGYDGHKADIWSAGCVLYFLLTKGQLLFDMEDTVYGVLKAISQARDPLPQLATVTDTQGLLNVMLVVDVGKRLTARQLLEHPWLSPTHTESVSVGCCSIS
jgi:serine/threonine protein kinase